MLASARGLTMTLVMARPESPRESVVLFAFYNGEKFVLRYGVPYGLQCG